MSCTPAFSHLLSVSGDYLACSLFVYSSPKSSDDLSSSMSSRKSGKGPFAGSCPRIQRSHLLTSQSSPRYAASVCTSAVLFPVTAQVEQCQTTDSSCCFRSIRMTLCHDRLNLAWISESMSKGYAHHTPVRPLQSSAALPSYHYLQSPFK